MFFLVQQLPFNETILLPARGKATESISASHHSRALREEENSIFLCPELAHTEGKTALTTLQAMLIQSMARIVAGHFLHY